MSVLIVWVVGTAANDEAERAVLFRPGKQRMTFLATERLKVGHRCAISCQNAETLARCHGTQCTIGAQHGDWAGGALHVENGLAHARILRPRGRGSKRGK